MQSRQRARRLAGSSSPPFGQHSQPISFQPTHPPLLPPPPPSGRFPQLGFTMDYGKASIAFAGATGVSIHDALKAGGYEPILLFAMLFVIINLLIGVHVSTTGRRHRTVAFVNFCACFVPLIIAMAHGGEFKPGIVKSIYEAIPT